ncbi:mechanosensitive ion channel family protein [Hyphococcus sp.]|uniref:mechanosensitive ion channel family protein n=1 Tax=Hyphococcus sp. TaxID=2038636 RepID=UPI003CCB8B74
MQDQENTAENEAAETEMVDTEVDVTASLVDQLVNYAEGFIRALPNIGLAIVALLLTWFAAKFAATLIRRALQGAKVRRALVDLLSTLTAIGVWVLGVLIAATILFPSVEPASILAALGVGGIAIGFAFKDIFENFMAGAMIMLRKPMRIGDFIECESVEGKVEEITIRDTYVRQTDDQLVLVPNAMLFKNPVYVRTDKERRRFEIIAGVGYGEDVDKCRDIIQKTVESIEGIDRDRGVDVFAREFNSSSIDFTVRWWTGSKPRDMHESRDKVIAGIKRALDDAGIEIPFPYRTLTFPETLRLSGEDKEENSEKPDSAKTPETA